MGKTGARPFGSCKRWRIPTLEELSRKSFTPPTIQRITLPISKSKKAAARCKTIRKMGTTPRTTKTVSLLAAQRHSRVGKDHNTERPSKGTTEVSITQKYEPTQLFRRELRSVRRRPGATKEMPITIEDDGVDGIDADDEANELMSSPSRASCRSTSHTPQEIAQLPPRPSLRSQIPLPPITSYSMPGRTSYSPALTVRAPYPTPPTSATPDPTDRRASIPVGSYLNTLNAAKSSKVFSRVKENTPGPWKYRPRKPGKVLTTAQGSRHSEGSDVEDTDDGGAHDLTLADIMDPKMRENVARLMKVAPGLPVRDLYNFMVDYNGHFEKAKKHAIRLSGPPSLRMKSEHPARFAVVPCPTGLPEKPYNNELLVKIDLNEAAFEWDTDTPPPPDRSEKQRRPRKLQEKDGRCRTKGQAKKSPAKYQANVAVKRSKELSRRKRENSITRFVVPDNVIYLDTDCSPSGGETLQDQSSAIDTDVEMQDAVSDDLENLTINMCPQHVFNAGLLGSRRKR